VALQHMSIPLYVSRIFFKSLNKPFSNYSPDENTLYNKKTAKKSILQIYKINYISFKNQKKGK
jgi:hypothetical protein